MNTAKWGHHGWKYIFYTSMGYDLNKLPKSVKDKQYIAFFKSIGDTLPCYYCRASYKQFYKQLDIKKYLKSNKRYTLVRFTYDLKNLVNDKLQKQETLRLKEQINNLNPNSVKLWEDVRKVASSTCYTKDTPKFTEVIKWLNVDKAKCSKKMKTCRK